MFNKYSLSARRFALLTSCSLLLASTGCQKEADVSPSPSATTNSQDIKGIKEPVNKGKYLSFASSADFLAIAKQLDQLEAGESSTNHLEKWERKYGFYSLRAHYAKKRKEKEKKEEQQGTLLAQNTNGGTAQSLLMPVDGETPIEDFYPYEEVWDEGLIIEDDYFAAMLSPEGTVQIEDKIFHIDLANNIVSYIPATRVGMYEEFLVAQPTSGSESIRYFNMSEDVFGLIAAGDEGTSYDSFTIRIGSGIGCGPGANRMDVKSFQYYASNRRLDCKLVYQPLGIYHSIIAKAHHQKKTWYGAWLGSPATITLLPNSGAYWQPLCETFVDSDTGSYDNFNSPWYGDNNGDDNTVSHRYFNYMKGMKRFKADVRFRVGQFTTSNFGIQANW